MSIFLAWPLHLSLAALLLNDYFLKHAYPSYLTGKLSDFSGIFLLSIIAFAFIPGRSFFVSTVIALPFAFWKSSFSQPLIDQFNAAMLLQIDRVVDYTDLVALSVIPIALLIDRHRAKFIVSGNAAYALRYPALFASALAIMGTSMMATYDTYALKDVSDSEQFDQGLAVKAIADVAKQFELHCVRCNPKELEGQYSNDSLTLRYQITEQSRSVQFHTSDLPLNPFFGNSSREKLDRLKRAIKTALEDALSNVEYVE